MFEKLTEKLESFRKLGTPGYDCVVYHKGKCVYRHYSGYSDMENQVSMQGNERYYVYSCSKFITCVAALQLYERGLLSWGDHLSQYLPEFATMYISDSAGVRRTERQIVIKDLFCMTAGFSYNYNSPMLQRCRKETEGRCTTREVMRYLAQEPLLFEPGERWEYGFCHDVLAAVIEVVAGMRFADYVKHHIFVPLGMKSSTFLPDANDIEELCIQYSYDCTSGISRTDQSNVYRLGREYESGGAGCITTVEDYIRFLEGLRKGQLLRQSTLKLMSKNQLNEKQLKTFWIAGYGYGLGVRCPLEDGNVSDIGWGGAAGSYPILDMEHELTLFYAQHVLNSPVVNDQLRDELRRIVLDCVDSI